MDDEQQRRRLFAALDHCLAGRAAHQPLLAVEDLHWSDEGSLDFLLYLARHSTSRPLLLLGTYRDDETSPALRHWLAQALERLNRGSLPRGHESGERETLPLALDRGAVLATLGRTAEAESVLRGLVTLAQQRGARGRSNREIAAALVLGERTVETHVSNILAKFGADSRQAIAAWADARGLAS